MNNIQIFKQQRIQFKEWLPDQPSILDAVSEDNNVQPKQNCSYSYKSYQIK